MGYARRSRIPTIRQQAFCQRTIYTGGAPLFPIGYTWKASPDYKLDLTFEQPVTITAMDPTKTPLLYIRSVSDSGGAREKGCPVTQVDEVTLRVDLAGLPSDGDDRFMCFFYEPTLVAGGEQCVIMGAAGELCIAYGGPVSP